MVVEFNFNCPKCGTLIKYDISMGSFAKSSDTQICKCPECKTVVNYSNINLQPKKKGKNGKILSKM